MRQIAGVLVTILGSMALIFSLSHSDFAEARPTKAGSSWAQSTSVRHDIDSLRHRFRNANYVLKPQFSHADSDAYWASEEGRVARADGVIQSVARKLSANEERVVLEAFYRGMLYQGYYISEFVTDYVDPSKVSAGAFRAATASVEAKIRAGLVEFAEWFARDPVAAKNRLTDGQFLASEAWVSSPDGEILEAYEVAPRVVAAKKARLNRLRCEALFSAY